MAMDLRSLRPPLVFLLLLIIIAGGIYPALITEVAQTVVPGTANGSLITGPNGEVIGSSLLGQNITCNPGAYSNLSSCPYRTLFWLRPSPANYQAFNGSENESGVYNSTNQALYNLTMYYMNLYGRYNVSVPIDLASQSDSGLDPDILPQAALVQVYRVNVFTNISIATLTNLVNGQVVNYADGYIGVAYVNVVSLDIALLQLEGQKA
jgi:K+-transporting ATPase ATPase C chain